MGRLMATTQQYHGVKWCLDHLRDFQHFWHILYAWNFFDLFDGIFHRSWQFLIFIQELWHRFVELLLSSFHVCSQSYDLWLFTWCFLMRNFPRMHESGTSTETPHSLLSPSHTWYNCFKQIHEVWQNKRICCNISDRGTIGTWMTTNCLPAFEISHEVGWTFSFAFLTI